MTFGSTFGRTFSPTFKPKSQAPAAASSWWLAGGIAAANCIAAYQPVGAASYAASLDNLTGNASYDASSAAAPDWDATNGWKFVSANKKYVTSNVPVNVIGATGTFIVRFAGYDYTQAGFEYLFGVSIQSGVLYVGWRYYDAIGRNAPSLFTNATVYKDGVDIEGAAVLAVANRNAYKDGSFLVTIAAAESASSTLPFEFGRVTSVIYCTMNVLAAAFYSTELTAQQISDLTTAMNAL